MASKKRQSDATPALAALHAAGITVSSHTYDHDPRAESFGLEAATALGLDPARVFKTLMVDAGGDLCVGVVPVIGALDLKAIAHALGVKHATMADPAHAQRATGYVLGGISPVGQRTAHRTVIDESALEFETIYVSGGRRGLDIELAPADLIAVTKASTAPIAR